MSKWLIVGLSGVTNGGKTTLTQKLLNVLPTGTKIIKQDNYFYPEEDPHHVPCPGGLKHHNWDVISAINMEKMIKDVLEITESHPTLTNSGANSVSGDSVGEVTNSGANSIGGNSVKAETNSQPLTNSGANSVSGNSVGEVTNSQPLTNSGANTVSGNSGPRPILLLDGFLLYEDPKLTKMCDLRYFLTLSRDECWERRKLRMYDPPDPPGYFDLCVWPMYEKHLDYIQKNVQDVTILDGSVDHFPHVLHTVLSLAGLKPTADQCGSSGECAYV